MARPGRRPGRAAGPAATLTPRTMMTFADDIRRALGGAVPPRPKAVHTYDIELQIPLTLELETTEEAFDTMTEAQVIEQLQGVLQERLAALTTSDVEYVDGVPSEWPTNQAELDAWDAAYGGSHDPDTGAPFDDDDSDEEDEDSDDDGYDDDEYDDDDDEYDDDE